MNPAVYHGISAKGFERCSLAEFARSLTVFVEGGKVGKETVDAKSVW